MAKKINVAILFGGQSVEHEISILSAKSVVETLDPQKYDLLLIWIDKKGGWHLLGPEGLEGVGSDEGLCGIIPHSNPKGVLEIETGKTHPIDVAFPVLHGPLGEDGTIQGLFELAGIPYVGADVLGSAVGMDKEAGKRLLRDAGIRTAEFVAIHAHERHFWTFEKVVEHFPLPFFVKPANAGSSIGIGKVVAPSHFDEKVDHAFAFDQKILIERAVHGREIECGVIGNEHPTVSLPCEVNPHGEFHSYRSKYLDLNGAEFQIPVLLEPNELGLVQQTALQAYQALGCAGFARLDLFLTPESEVLVNEINTIPGLTPMSPFPKMWEASGLTYIDLLDRLVQFALDRAEKKNALQRDFSHIEQEVGV